MLKNEKRFIPQKRQALDGKIWWCVWDKKRNNWSTFIFHGKYKTKSQCQLYIDISLSPQYQEFYEKA